MNRFLILVFTVAALTACGGKKKPLSLSGDDKVSAKQFVEFSEPLKLTYIMMDTTVQKKDKDSLLISKKIFTQFIPDSIFHKVYGKQMPKIYAIGKAKEGYEKTYLLIKAVQGDKKTVYMIGLNEDLEYVGYLEALRPDNNKSTTQALQFDNKFGITKTVVQTRTDGSTIDGKDVYAFSDKDKGGFNLVLTDALIDRMELINPIDTLPRKGKFAGDYATGKWNLVSIRDAKRDGQIHFFIHIQNAAGDCTGELKGEATMRTPTTAEYREGGDPCVLTFTFSNNAVRLSEVEPCGSRRGRDCSFNNSFPKKKNSPAVAGKK